MENQKILEARLRLIEFSFSHSLLELLQKTLDEAEELTGSCIGFYHFLHSDQQMLTLQAWSTRTAAVFCKAKGSGSHYPVAQAGVWVDCLHERRPVIHNDYASLTHRKGLPEGHAAVLRELVVPVFRGNRIVSILGVGNKSTDYDRRDVDVVSLLADLAWDIAERKQAEDELHLQTRRLEQEIADRQQAQEELSLRHRELEELNRTLEQRVETTITELRIKDQLMFQQNRQAAMGEMVNNIAHQWKQPLNNLALMIQAVACDFSNGLLTEKQMETDSQKCLDLISFMSQTMDDFRSFFLIDRKKVSFGLRAGIERAVRLLSASLKKHAVSVRIDCAAEIQATGYPNEFSQVLLNLLGNARDVFIERSLPDPVITVHLYAESDSAVLTVADNGGGIAPDVIEHVFDPFFTTKGYGGSGIGLFMSRNIIEQHMGGSLSVCNRDGGACFRIELPLS